MLMAVTTMSGWHKPALIFSLKAAVTPTVLRGYLLSPGFATVHSTDRSPIYPTMGRMPKAADRMPSQRKSQDQLDADEKMQL